MKNNFIIGLYLLPTLVFAQNLGDDKLYSDSGVRGFIGSLIDILNAIIPLIFGVAIVLFLWGIAKAYFLSGDDSDSRKEGRNLIIWGVIALFIMIAFWGFVNLLNREFFEGVISRPEYPSVLKSGR